MSHSNSSSRASSQDPPHKTAHDPKSRLKHTVSLSSLRPLKDNLERKPKTKAKLRKNKPSPQLLASPFVSRASSPVATHILTSHANKRRDTLLSHSKKRAALAETFIDSNLPADSRPTSRSRSRHRKSPADVLQRAYTSPERGSNDDAHRLFKSRRSPSTERLENVKRRHTRGEENLNPLKRDLAEGRLFRKQTHDRNRRPSAPSSLLRPRPRPLPFRVPAPAGNADIPNSNAKAEKHRLASRLDVILGPIRHTDDAGPPDHQQRTTSKLDPTIPLTSTQALIRRPIHFAHQKRQANVNDEDSDASMAWMHRRSGVNFNRPPSQMEFLGPPGGISGLGFGLDDPVFTSDDQGSSDEVVTDQIPMVTKGRLGLDLDGERFGEDARGISTPFKDVNIQNGGRGRELSNALSNQDQRPRLAGRLNSQLVPLKSQFELKADDDKENGEDEGQDQEEISDNGSGEDMELTASATFGYANAVGAIDQHSNLHEGDMTTWITDSLISPPTVYLERRKNVGDTAARVAGGQEGKTTLASTTYLSSPFRLTLPTGFSTPFTEITDNEQDESENKKGEAVIEQQFNLGGATTTGSTKVTNATTNKSFTRTRSGTIVSANAMPPGARRTRSGTIVGPLAAPPAPPPSNKVFVGSTRRTRSGTIVASITGTPAGENGLASQSEKFGRVRSGSMLKTKDRQIQPRPTANSDADDSGGGTATANKEPLARNKSNSDSEFDFDADSESEDAAECFVDSLYVPRRSSSPDPINFLCFASIEEGDDEVEQLPMEFAPGNEAHGMRWCAVEEPPSPEVQKRQGVGRGGRFGLSGGILGGRGRGKGGARKASKNLTARFVGGEEIQRRKKGKEKEMEMEMEDDELLLLPGQSASLWI